MHLSGCQTRWAQRVQAHGCALSDGTGCSQGHSSCPAMAPRRDLCLTQWRCPSFGGVWLWLHHSVVLRSLLSSGETSPHSPATTLPIWEVQPSHPAWEQGIHTPWRLQAPAPIWVTSEHELSLPIWSPCTASGKIYIVLKHSTVLSTEMIELQMLTRCRTLFLLLKT